MSSLKREALRGVFWSFVERFGTQFILLLTQIVLARLLLPGDFGLIGMLSIFMAIAQSFVDSGFGNALIQKKDTDNVDYSTVFYFNLAISVLVYALLFVSAPAIAAFFKQEKLVLLTRVLGLMIIFNGLGLIQFAKFRRELNFKAIAKSNLVANTLAAGIGITLAFMKFGVMALAIQMLCIYFFKTVLFWIISDWRPKWVFSFKSFKGLFSFGSKLLLSGIMDQVFENIYVFIIGKYYSKTDTGYYTQAKKFQEVPVTTLSAIVGSVTFPAFSKIQDDDERLRIGFQKLIKLLVFFNFPLMLGLAAIAENLFLHLIGAKWLPAVPYFQLLCIAGMLYTLHTSNLSLLQVKGRSDLFFRLEVVKKVIILLAIVIGINWGILGLIIGRVISSFIAYAINAFYSGRLIGYGIFQQLRDIYTYAITSVVMAVGVYMIGMMANSLLVLLLQIFTGLIFYLLMALIFKQDALIDSFKLIQAHIVIPPWIKKRF